MLENSDFEQKLFSRTATGICKVGHDNVRSMKWICFYDRSQYEKLKYYDLMGIIVNSVK